jgi:hypothetical protein
MILPLLIAAGALGWLLTKPSTNSTVEVVSGAPGSTLARLVAPSQGESPKFRIPPDAASATFYETSAGGASIYSTAAMAYIEDSAGRQVYRVSGPQILAMNGRVALPVGAAYLKVFNNSAANTPGMHLTVVFQR